MYYDRRFLVLTVSLKRPLSVASKAYCALPGSADTASVPSTASRGVLKISEGFIDCASRDAGEDGVGALVVRQGDQPDGQCLAATARPRRVIDWERCAEDVPGLGGEEIPRDDQVARGIAHAQTPEVDDGADPAPFDQQVPW